MTSTLPRTFRFSVSGFSPDSYLIVFTKPVLEVRTGFPDSYSLDRAVIMPSPEQWTLFKSALDELNVWAWQKHYIKHGVDDGTQWSFACTWGSNRVRAEGDNAFPHGFDRLVAAVGVLVGRAP